MWMIYADTLVDNDNEQVESGMLVIQNLNGKTCHIGETHVYTGGFRSQDAAKDKNNIMEILNYF